jgi:predicted Zn-dependent protease
VIRRRDLVRALEAHELADWVLLEREQHVAVVDDASGVARSEQRRRWQLTVHHDAPTGRGSAHVSIEAADGDADATVRDATTLARASLGPVWVTRPPAAPARVKVADESLASREPLDVAQQIARELPRPAPGAGSVQATIQVMRETVSALARQGLRTEWTATEVRGELLVIAGARSLVVERAARRTSDLDLRGAISSAVLDLELLASAGPPPPGPCTLVLRADAMLHGNGGLGVWSTLVAQANAIVERQGLTRYRERTPIVPGATSVAHPLVVTSDGALDYGLYSAPISDDGAAVRRFQLVDRGLAAGLGLSPREAALRGRDPNGGVRNLVVAPGAWAGDIVATEHRVIEVRRLRDLTLDPYTGEASLEIALGIANGKGARVAFTGGSIRLDMIAALALGARSKSRIRRGPYSGPDALVFDSAELLT